MMNFTVDLEGLNYAYPEETRYEPELFPGLIFEMPAPKVTIMVFVHGKVCNNEKL